MLPRTLSPDFAQLHAGPMGAFNTRHPYQADVISHGRFCGPRFVALLSCGVVIWSVGVRGMECLGAVLALRGLL
jgi:hypothetical protein